jgi:hypothetical protein
VNLWGANRLSGDNHVILLLRNHAGRILRPSTQDPAQLTQKRQTIVDIVVKGEGGERSGSLHRQRIRQNVDEASCRKGLLAVGS